jgi:hypothetical protein
VDRRTYGWNRRFSLTRIVFPRHLFRVSRLSSRHYSSFPLNRAGPDRSALGYSVPTCRCYPCWTSVQKNVGQLWNSANIPWKYFAMGRVRSSPCATRRPHSESSAGKWSNSISSFHYMGPTSDWVWSLCSFWWWIYYSTPDRLCGLVIRVPGCKTRGPGFDSRRYQIFWVAVGLQRGPLSPCEDKWGAIWKKSSGSGLDNWE